MGTSHTGGNGEQVGNTNWNAMVNVANVRERGTGGRQPETGAYKVKITGTEEYEKDGKVGSVMFQTVIVGGEFDGVETRLYIGLDMSKVGILRSWRAALASIGIPADDLDRGDLNIGGETFNGAEAYIYYTRKEPSPDGKSQSDREFITPAQYANFTADAAPTAPAVNPPAARAAIPAVASKGPATVSVPAMSVPQPTGAAARLRGMAAQRQQ